MKMTPHKSSEHFPETWLVLDARDVVLGRLASEVAFLLRGKHRPSFSPSVDARTHCVVLNVEQVKLTGNKLTDKLYYRHTTRPGSLKARTAQEMMATRPEDVLREAVRRMLPKNRLGRQLLGHLKVYRGDRHPHAAQKPHAVKLTERGELVYPLDF